MAQSQKAYKVAGALPGSPEINSQYFLKEGSAVRQFVTDSTGSPFLVSGLRLFQSLKTTAQATTTAFTDVVAWDVPTISDTGFTFNNTTGVLTLIDAGVYEVSAHLLGDLIANNRSELAVKLVDSSGDVPGALDRQYAMRNAGADQGSCQFSSFLYVAVAGETLKLQEERVGSTANIVAAKFTVKKVQ